MNKIHLSTAFVNKLSSFLAGKLLEFLSKKATVLVNILRGINLSNTAKTFVVIVPETVKSKAYSSLISEISDILLNDLFTILDNENEYLHIIMEYADDGDLQTKINLHKKPSNIVT